jgi:quercetin dioxygenase-like cupin family protein
MLAVHLNEVEFQEPWVEGAPHQTLRFVFPLLGKGPENEASSLVYFELEPGNELVRHTDSAEELLFIVQGRLEVSVGDETGIVEGPAFALVPALAPHSVRNIGSETAKVGGFFAARHVVSHFDQVWQPINTNVVDTAQIEQSLVAVE